MMTFYFAVSIKNKWGGEGKNAERSASLENEIPIRERHLTIS